MPGSSSAAPGNPKSTARAQLSSPELRPLCFPRRKAGWVPSMPMPAALWPNTLHRHSIFCETDQEAVNKAKLYAGGPLGREA